MSILDILKGGTAATLLTYDAEKNKYLPYLGKDQAAGERSGKAEEIRTTPLFTLKVKHSTDNIDQPEITTGAPQTTGLNAPRILPHYGLLGFHVGENHLIGDNEPIMMNTRAPNSTFICGSQGSGKSYTLSCMLENCLQPNEAYGPKAPPLAGIVFHYDLDAADSLAEVAGLCSKGIKVNVLVSKSNFKKLSKAYMKVEGASGHLSVDRLLFRDSHLSIERMHKLMAFSESENGVPLYMEVVQKALREMAEDDKAFSFTRFYDKIRETKFSPQQSNMLEMRLDLLRSFLDAGVVLNERPKRDIFKTEPGVLTIIDLSDPFVDSSSVCVLFDICLGVLKQNRPDDGMIIALDEAHKYLNTSPAAANFTDRLLLTIREQRHNATRVVISTQEPTISEKLLDLCSVSIVHRFSSPAWFHSIKNHLGGAASLIASAEKQQALLSGIVELDTGESFVFSPSSFLCCVDEGKPKKLGTGIMKMKTRKRDCLDMGMSKLAGNEVD